MRLLIRVGCAVCLMFATVSTARADDAATLYKANCIVCHGADGSGTAVGKTLAVHDFHAPDIQKMTDAELAASIAKGKNKMPPYEKTLKPAEIKALVAYVRELAKKK